MPDLATLDAVPAAAAETALLSCCGSRAWARAMALRRPFRTREALLRAADDVWWSLGADDWLEAFRAHPRIGERRAERAQPGDGDGWSADEQSGTRSAEAALLAELAEGNRAYEARFGHIYIVCATGRSADELLAVLRSRLGNDAETELRVAAEEQRRITRIRLEKLIGP
ncbi:MAG TPA: 2-oxo-4-hydroxy-4-carboxy-5-ureidoimidazoline decarboxylase [Longimicrobiales bacterium]|nr:2-oxo-4-hydroxy-4-carboxy-5-ureidoimidazoline decarboxylase [Longimicrobiales bacterium]